MNNYINYMNFDAYDGFIRGNMFKNLYKPYKKNEPYNIKPMNEQAELLTYIDCLCFALVDIDLYLDVNPNDKNMISLYNRYRLEKDNYIREYESKYGPLTLDSDSLERMPWSWLNMPWPWDN